MGLDVRAYHRVDPLMDERKGHYSPSQLGAFVKVQLLAGRQRCPGRFRSLEAVANIVPASYVEHIPFLVAEGDLIVQPDGTVYLDGWDEWQEGDLTVSERMSRLRNRRRNAGVTDTVTATVTEPVTSTVTRASPSANANAVADASSPEGGLGGTAIPRDVQAAWESATGRTILASGRFPYEYLDDACRRHEAYDVIVKIKRARAQFDRVPEVAALAMAVKALLDPPLDPKAVKQAADPPRRRAGTPDPALLKARHNRGEHIDAPTSDCPSCRESEVVA